MKKTALSILVLATLMAAMPVRAEFAHSALLIVSGYSGPALADFPVLVRLSPERIAGFAYDDVASGLGADIAGDFTMDPAEVRRSAAMLVLQAAPTNSPTDVAMRFAVGSE